MTGLPKRLKKDAIAEALCEIRFECDESSPLPEIVVGKLAEFDEWQSFSKIRLPAADIPLSLRMQDQGLKSQPVLELKDKEGTRSVKIGVNAMSIHRLTPYPGWTVFQEELRRSTEYLFSRFKDFHATRMGLRYVNVFTPKDHQVEGVSDLNYSLFIGKESIVGPQNINYKVPKHDDAIVMVRIASQEFVVSNVTDPVYALVDVDVSTPAKWETRDSAVAIDWIGRAHTAEKSEFFRLFTEKMMDRLVEAA